jgi:aldose 1-epimerase
MLKMRTFLFCFLAFILSTEACLTEGKDRESMTTTVFGKLSDGREVHQYTLINKSGAVAKIIDYGATITALSVPDRNGKMDDVVLGCDSLQGYLDGTAYWGAIVGRYGNRIGKGRFQLDGKEYQLAVNNGENHLHGGKIGFDKVLWEVKSLNEAGEPSIRLQYISKDGEEGYPGNVTLRVRYTLTEKNELRIDYEGTTDKPTILNPTQHSYFNLSGSFTHTILDHQLMIESDGFTPVDKGLIPTGQIVSVVKTPMDFRTLTAIGSHINDSDEQLKLGGGYDHNWVLRNYSGKVRKAAELYDPSSGRIMTVLTDQPGIQFYSGNFLDGSAKGKNGIQYRQRTGLCLETQAYPDTPNKPDFPQVTLRPGKTYRQTTIYQFSAR